MEESVKRRERLKAMRMEATDVEVSNGQAASPGPGNLSNPFLDCAATPSVPGDRRAVSRFDFYTDPMAAFSSSKKRNIDGGLNHQGYFSPPFNNSSPMGRMMPSAHSAGARNPNMSPAPNQFHLNYSPGSYETPFSLHQATSPTVSGAWNNSSPCYGRGYIRNLDYGHGRGSPKTNSGRGYCRGSNNFPSPGSGRTNGRGRGSHAVISAKEQPGRFYRKSMVEDPWRFLKPVVRISVPITKDLRTPDTLKSWLPKSLSMKKAKISEVAAGFCYQTSLADCLSGAVEEAVEAVDNN